MSFIKKTGDIDEFPIWVSRKDADDRVFKLFVGPPALIISLLLAQVAVVLWLGIAIVAAVVLIVNSIAGLF